MDWNARMSQSCAVDADDAKFWRHTRCTSTPFLFMCVSHQVWYFSMKSNLYSNPDKVVERSEQKPEGAVGNTSSACLVGVINRWIHFFVCNEMKAMVSDPSFKYLFILFVLVLEGRRQAFGPFQMIFDLIQTKQTNALEKRSMTTLIYLVSDLPEIKVFYGTSRYKPRKCLTRLY